MKSLNRFLEEIYDTLLSFYNIPKELKKIMASFEEVVSAFGDLKETIAEEAEELNAKFDSLEDRIEELLGNQMPDVQPLIDDIRATIAKVEALSEGTEEEPLPEEPETPAEM